MLFPHLLISSFILPTKFAHKTAGKAAVQGSRNTGATNKSGNLSAKNIFCQRRKFPDRVQMGEQAKIRKLNGCLAKFAGQVSTIMRD
jgi:hypothetical protein